MAALIDGINIWIDPPTTTSHYVYRQLPSYALFRVGSSLVIITCTRPVSFFNFNRAALVNEQFLILYLVSGVSHAKYCR